MLWVWKKAWELNFRQMAGMRSLNLICFLICPGNLRKVKNLEINFSFHNTSQLFCSFHLTFSSTWNTVFPIRTLAHSFLFHKLQLIHPPTSHRIVWILQSTLLMFSLDLLATTTIVITIRLFHDGSHKLSSLTHHHRQSYPSLTNGITRFRKTI